MIFYFCKYTPIEIFAGFDEEVDLYNPVFENLDGADELIHRNVCSFSRAIINGRVEDKSGTLVFTDCCDSIKRAWDVLNNLGQDTLMLSLPRKQDCCGIELYKNELLSLIELLEKRYSKSFNIDKFRSAFKDQDNLTGKYISVMGGRISDEFIQGIEKMSPYPVKNNTCSGLRKLGQDIPENDNIEDIMNWYSKELLSQTPCMRMADVSSRKALVEDPNISGIIYNTVNFCDYYSFEYAKLRDNVSAPMLKIETDSTRQGEGQMMTRLEAFFEEINSKNNNNRKKNNSHINGYFVGIDSGSTSTNAVILDKDKNLVSFYSLPTGAKVAMSANQAIEGALKEANLGADSIKGTVTTGYGRNAIDFKKRDVTEITCHAKGAHFLNPNIRTVIDIGGQDSKIIRLDKNGDVENFVMNDKCAAGTGRFLELMAASLGLTIEDMAKRGMDPKENITISSMCSVFAQSEVVSLVAAGKEVDDIIYALNRSVAAKVISLAGRRKMENEVMMTGGVARNKGVVDAISERVEQEIIVPEEPDICGALGAALFALDN